MAPREELDSPAAVVTSALLGLQGLALLAPLVTKDRWAFRETPGPQACQVRPEDLQCRTQVPGALGSVTWGRGSGFSSARRGGCDLSNLSLAFLYLVPSFTRWASGV